MSATLCNMMVESMKVAEGKENLVKASGSSPCMPAVGHWQC